jgi:hypothetical protein
MAVFLLSTYLILTNVLRLYFLSAQIEMCLGDQLRVTFADAF